MIYLKFVKEALIKSNYFRLAKSADIFSEDRSNSPLLMLTSKKIATLFSSPNSNRLNQSFLKASFLFLIVSFFSINSFAQLKPYIAVYDIYSKGFHLGEATQTLTQQGDQWLISLSSKATGFASLFQSNPATEEQLFTFLEQHVLLISAKSDSGENEEDAKTSAYFDMENQLLYVRVGNKTKQLKHHSALSSFLLLPITAATLHKQQTIEVTLYDEGEIIKKTVSRLTNINEQMTVDVYSPDSDKKLRYTFKNNNVQVPFRIERFKKNEITAYLELISFN